MRQEARVTKLLDNERAEVAVRRASACGGSCASCGGCASQRLMRVSADNGMGAVPGDIVEIDSSSRQVLGIAALVYILPLALLFVGYFAAAGFETTGRFAPLFAVLGLALGLFAAYRAERALRGRAAVEFKIVRVLRKGD